MKLIKIYFFMFLFVSCNLNDPLNLDNFYEKYARCIGGIFAYSDYCNGEQKNEINQLNGTCNLILLELANDCSETF